MVLLHLTTTLKFITSKEQYATFYIYLRKMKPAYQDDSLNDIFGSIVKGSGPFNKIEEDVRADRGT